VNVFVLPKDTSRQQQEGVVSVPLKMEHVRERVRASQGFTFTVQTPGIEVRPLSDLVEGK
jgi:hypothetical protein